MIKFNYIFPVLLVFAKPKQLALMNSLDLHETFFFYDYSILFLYSKYFFNRMILYADTFWSRNALAKIN